MKSESHIIDPSKIHTLMDKLKCPWKSKKNSKSKTWQYFDLKRLTDHALNSVLILRLGATTCVTAWNSFQMSYTVRQNLPCKQIPLNLNHYFNLHVCLSAFSCVQIDSHHTWVLHILLLSYTCSVSVELSEAMQSKA